jgi:hypothetical protein
MTNINESIINIYDLLPHTFIVLGPFVSHAAITKLVEEFDERFTEEEKIEIINNIIAMAQTDGFTILPEEKFQELFAILADWAVLNNYAEVKTEDQELPAPDPQLHPATGGFEPIVAYQKYHNESRQACIEQVEVA